MSRIVPASRNAAVAPRVIGGMRAWGAAMAAVIVLTACTASPLPPAQPSESGASSDAPVLVVPCGESLVAVAPVSAFFTCADDDAVPPWDVYPVPRDVHAADALSRLEASLTGLVAGPTDVEAAAGYTSWFSEQTANALNGVGLDLNGLAIVDLGDIRPFMGGASTSTGMEGLLSQLNATVFQVEEVAAVEYRINGSCRVFWEWLQGWCHVVRRP